MESAKTKTGGVSPYERYTMEAFARMGDQMFDRFVRPKLQPQDDGKFVAIDVETGEHEMGDDELTVLDRLAARRPDAGVWLVRVGREHAHRLGGRRQNASL